MDLVTPRTNVGSYFFFAAAYHLVFTSTTQIRCPPYVTNFEEECKRSEPHTMGNFSEAKCVSLCEADRNAG